MDDIEALHLLRQRKDALEQLPTPNDPNLSFKKYEEIVSKTMTKTQTDIEKVSKYAKEIIEEFEKVRELVKNCNVKIGEQLQDLMKKNLLKDSKRFISAQIHSEMILITNKIKIVFQKHYLIWRDNVSFMNNKTCVGICDSTWF